VVRARARGKHLPHFRLSPPLSPPLSHPPSLSRSSVVQAEEARALFFSRRFGSEDRFVKAGTVFEKELESHVLLGGYAPIVSKRFRSLKHLVCVTGETDDGIVRFRDIPVYGNDGDYADGDDVAAAQVYLSKSDAVLVPYTAGGADGRTPVRGKALSHADALAAAAAAAKALAIKSTDVVVLTAPLHHPLALIGGALAPASVTAKTVLPHKTFDAAKTLAAATLQRATVIVTVPEHVAPLNAELAADAAKPAAKRAYSLATLRAGVVLTAAGAPAGGSSSLGSTPLKAVEAGKGFA
jgi:acyl-CoA synthetase (AMP-forming)/AMP-acid ligase II